MKNSIKYLLTMSLVLAASNAFAAAAVLSPGTTYSLGSTQPTVFKTSPKVSIITDMTSAPKATSWVANSLHESALGKAKGLQYGTSSDDPGTYSTSTSALSQIPSTLTALSSMTQEK